MKIQKQTNCFKPITITLETSDELDSFYTGIYDLLLVYKGHTERSGSYSPFNDKRNNFLLSLIDKLKGINNETT
jgi:hypothetical protein